MQSDRLYLTPYLMKKYDMCDDKIISNIKNLRKIINKSNYNSRLKKYDEIGPILVKLLKNSSNKELDLLTFSKILEISNLMNDLEINESLRKFDMLVSCMFLGTDKMKKVEKIKVKRKN